MIVDSEYFNSGGNVYVMWGSAQKTPLCPEKTVYFHALVDVYDTPVVWFFRSEKERELWYGECCRDPIAWLSPSDAKWVDTLFRKAFRNVIANFPNDKIAKADYWEYLDIVKGRKTA